MIRKLRSLFKSASVASVAGVAVGIALTWLAMAPALAQPDTAMLNYEGPDRTEKIIAAAKREGVLTLYTTFAEKDFPTLLKPFEAKYGIKVTVWRGGTEKVLQRTLAETRARRYDVDLIHFGSPEMEALYREQVLQPVKSPVFADLRSGSVPAHRNWVVTLLSVWVQAYNTNAIKRADLPRSFQDLLDPKWKGKLGIEAKNQEWFATVAESMRNDAEGNEPGIKFFRELARRNGMSIRQGHTLLNNMVVSGEVPLALTVYNYMPEQAKRKGAPIDWFALEPVVARSNAVGIARRATHPNAALLFYDYWLSVEAQQLLASMDYVPANTRVPSLLTGALKDVQIKAVDPVVTLDQLDRWTKVFNDTLVKRVGP